MRVLVLECALSLDVNAAMIADYADVARRHGDLSLTVLTREGVRDRLAGGVPEEVELLEEVPDYYTPGAVERRVMELLRNSSYDLLFAPREGTSYEPRVFARNSVSRARTSRAHGRTATSWR